MDPYKFLRISLNPDGSLSRFDPLILTPTSDNTAAFLCRDLPLNPARQTTLRLFLPNPNPRPGTPKIPVILYFHGGGFIVFRASSAPFHLLCSRLAADLPAIFLGVDYRLAPEHRLPAAYDDALDALLWLRSLATNKDCEADLRPLRDRADFSRCFLMGSSVGGTIAFHAALRVARGEPLNPVKIAGILLDQPYFGGVQRTESEERMKEDKIVPLAANDLMWELALPEGADRDLEFCNLVANEEKLLGGVANLPRCLVKGHTGDPLIDRQRELARMLARRGVSEVELLESDGYHGIELFEHSRGEELTEDVKRFVFNEDGGAAAFASSFCWLKKCWLKSCWLEKQGRCLDAQLIVRLFYL